MGALGSLARSNAMIKSVNDSDLEGRRSDELRPRSSETLCRLLPFGQRV